jgi:hypothetical protein
MKTRTIKRTGRIIFRIQRTICQGYIPFQMGLTSQEGEQEYALFCSPSFIKWQDEFISLLPLIPEKERPRVIW